MANLLENAANYGGGATVIDRRRRRDGWPAAATGDGRRRTAETSRSPSKTPGRASTRSSGPRSSSASTAAPPRAGAAPAPAPGSAWRWWPSTCASCTGGPGSNRRPSGGARFVITLPVLERRRGAGVVRRGGDASGAGRRGGGCVGARSPAGCAIPTQRARAPSHPSRVPFGLLEPELAHHDDHPARSSSLVPVKIFFLGPTQQLDAGAADRRKSPAPADARSSTPLLGGPTEWPRAAPGDHHRHPDNVSRCSRPPTQKATWSR